MKFELFLVFARKLTWEHEILYLELELECKKIHAEMRKADNCIEKDE